MRLYIYLPVRSKSDFTSLATPPKYKVKNSLEIQLLSFLGSIVIQYLIRTTVSQWLGYLVSFLVTFPYTVPTASKMTESGQLSMETSSIDYLAESYDYAIVGGGTSGLAVASRLTEDPNVTVLVLEAGSNKLDDSRISTPGLAVTTWDNPEFDWQFMTTPQVFPREDTCPHADKLADCC